MLTSFEIDEIQKVLTQILALRGGRPWFQGVFGGPDFMVCLSELAGAAASDEQIASAAIQVCVVREWRDNPPWLVRLLTRIGAESGLGGIGAVATLNAIVGRLQNKINILDDQWYVHWVQNGLPFVDREPLRDTLRDLARADGRPVLRIEGDAHSGKTYTNELLEHVSQTQGWSFKIIRVEVEKESALTMNALTLAQIIVGEMGFPNSPADSTLPDPAVHDIQLLQRWVLGKARASGKRWWLSLDGFGLLPEKNTARSLIQGLADNIANRSFRESLRLILIDYDKPLTRVEDERIAFDTPEARLADKVAVKAIQDCLDRLYKALGRQPASGEIETKTQAILTNVPEPWMVEVSKRLRAAARGIRNGQ
jgi:hypothetical protein